MDKQFIDLLGDTCRVVFDACSPPRGSVIHIKGWRAEYGLITNCDLGIFLYGAIDCDVIIHVGMVDGCVSIFSRLSLSFFRDRESVKKSYIL